MGNHRSVELYYFSETAEAELASLKKRILLLLLSLQILSMNTLYFLKKAISCLKMELGFGCTIVM